MAALVACGGGGSTANPSQPDTGSDETGDADVKPTAKVTHFSGSSGSLGNLEGPRSVARFFMPSGVARAADGTLYVVDASDATIRRIAPDGKVSVLAGKSGEQGTTDGDATTARFSLPVAIALGPDGALYVSDTAVGTIRRVATDGTVTTFAGKAGVLETTNGPRESARFHGPESLAFAKDGSLYVVDREASVVRRIAPDGAVTTFAGVAGEKGHRDGARAQALFMDPFGIAIADDGAIAIADSGNHVIRMIATDGAVSTLAGTVGVQGTEDGTGAAAQFGAPRALAFAPDGALIVADTFNNLFRRVTREGVVTKLAGSASSGVRDGALLEAQLTMPGGFALAVEGGKTMIYASETSGVIRRIGDRVETWAGLGADFGYVDGSAKDARYWNPRGMLEREDGTVLVADSLNHAIRVLHPDGRAETLIGGFDKQGFEDGTLASAKLDTPTSLVTDGAGGFYIADTGNNSIRHVSKDGAVTTYAGTKLLRGGDAVDGPRLDARFVAPTALVRDSASNLYLADATLHNLRKIAADGNVTTIAGHSGRPGLVDGAGEQAKFQNPYGMLVIDDTHLLVADTQNCAVRLVTLAPKVTVSTPAGLELDDDGEPQCKSVDGRGRKAGFRQVNGLVRESATKILISDTYGNLLRRLDLETGDVSTVAGTPGLFGIREGELPASLFEPYDILRRKDGAVLVTHGAGLLKIENL